MGPAAAESNATPDLLKEAGYKYVMDWPADDQPFWLKTRSGPILSVPYPAELNNSAAIIHREGTARDFGDMIVDGFDEMVEQCRAQPLVMTVSLHPFVMGQPFRLPALAQSADTLRQTSEARSGLVDHAGRSGGLLLRLAAGNHPRRWPETRLIDGDRGSGIVSVRASVQAHAARLDRDRPFLDLAIEKFLEIVR